MRLQYITAAFDGSGYGQAARNYIGAMLQLPDMDLYLVPLTFEAEHPILGNFGDVLQGLTVKPPSGPLDARILHCTPDLYAQLLHGQPTLPTIGYCTWETSRLPEGWATSLNAYCREVWVPSHHNVQVFQDSGVTVPVVRIPHCFPADRPVAAKCVLQPSDDYRFLSVFQWHERKNPLGLLKAYLTEFKPEEKVSLVLKTYLKDHNPAERDVIRGAIAEVKKGLFLPGYPKVELIVGVLADDQMARLYQDCDAFVLLHRCEGFGIPVAEAMLAGKPVLTTDYGGVHDFVPTEGLIRCSKTPVFGMPWQIYSGSMSWAEPDLGEAQAWMRHLVTHREAEKDEAKTYAARLAKDLSYATVGGMILERLQKVVGAA